MDSFRQLFWSNERYGSLIVKMWAMSKLHCTTVILATSTLA